MNRLIFSIIGGVFLSEIIYAGCLAASFLCEDFSGPTGLNSTQKIVTFPILWAMYLIEAVSPRFYQIISRADLLNTFIAGLNGLFYSAIIYVVFSILQRFRKPKINDSDIPEPPTF